MIASNCPRCRESFRLPSDELPEDAYAQCPWCSESFPISEVLNQLPPVLEVLSADGQPLTFKSVVPGVAAAGVAAAGLFGSDDLSIDAGDDDRSDDADFNNETVVDDGSGSIFAEAFDESNSDFDSHEDKDCKETVTEETWVNDLGEDLELHDDTEGQRTVAIEPGDLDSFGDLSEEPDEAEQGDELDPNDTLEEQQPSPDSIAPMKVSSTPLRRKKKSILRTILGPVMGGLLALPIAGGILWLAKVDLGFWPLTGYGVSQSNRSASPPADFDTKPVGQVMASAEPAATDDDPADDAIDQILSAQNSPNPAPSDPLAAGDLDGQDTNEPPNALAMPSDGKSTSSPRMKSEGPDEGVLILPIQDRDVASSDPATTETKAPPTLPSERPSTSIDNLAATSDSATGLPAMATEASDSLGLPVKSNDLDAIANDANGKSRAVDNVNAPELASSTANLPSSDLSKQIAVVDGMLAKLAAQGGKQQLNLLLGTCKAIGSVVDSADEDDLGALAQLADKIAASDALDDLELAGPEYLRYGDRSTKGVLLIGRPGANSNGQTIMSDSGKLVSLSGETKLPTATKVIAFGQAEIGIAQPTVELLYAQAIPQ